MELRPIPAGSWAAWYETELCTTFPSCECKPLEDMRSMAAQGRYQLLGLYEGAELLGYAALWSAPDWPGYVLLDYLGVTAARRNGGLGGRMLALLSERLAGNAVLLIEAEAADSGGPEEERPIRLRRLDFYRRHGCTPVYRSFNCGLMCQVFVLGPAPAELAGAKAAHRAIYGPGRSDTVIDPAPGQTPTPPYWMK